MIDMDMFTITTHSDRLTLPTSVQDAFARHFGNQIEFDCALVDKKAEIDKAELRQLYQHDFSKINDVVVEISDQSPIFEALARHVHIWFSYKSYHLRMCKEMYEIKGERLVYIILHML